MGEQWTIAMGDSFEFDIVKVLPRRNGEYGSDADLNGRFPTKLAALECHIEAQEETREALAKNIARAKRMRTRLLSKDQNDG